MINFLKYTKLYFLVSAICISIGLYSIVTKGYVLSIDFTGGTVIEYRVSRAFDQKKFLSFFSREKISVVDSSMSKDTIFLKTQPIDEKREVALRNKIEKQLALKLTTLRFETVGPLIGKEMIQKTIFASVIAIIGILLYMTFAFKSVTFGIAAVVAMAHDFLILMGAYSLVSVRFGAELDTLFVTALLTTLSFSVHDTIVLFDKIREYRKNTSEPFDVMANRAFSDTIVRSLNNSLTIVLMLTALVLIGGQTTRFFALALLIGTISGTYSSPFVAVPVLRVLEKKFRI